MSLIQESGGDERWNWLRGEEKEDVESGYTVYEEDPAVPPTPVEHDESENPDRVIQREDTLGILWLLHFSKEGKQKAQPPKPQSDQDNAIEAPSKLLYLEQNVHSFEGVCGIYRARRQARDRGPSMISKMSRGSLQAHCFPPLGKAPKGRKRSG